MGAKAKAQEIYQSVKQPAGWTNIVISVLATLAVIKGPSTIKGIRTKLNK